MTPTQTTPPHRPSSDEVGQIETRGVDFIPPEDRQDRPRDVGTVFLGANMCFGTIVLGALPILFGLGWWASFWAITVGTLLGTAFFGPVGLIGPRTGTNSAVSSGAFFGVVGRLVGSLVVLFIAIGFYALAVWTGGQAVVAGAHKLFALPQGTLQFAIAYGLIGVITVVLALIGHATLIASQKLIAPIVAVLLVVGVLIKLPDFDPGYAGGHYVLGGFWPTWVLSVVTSASLALSYGPFANDYARYLPVRAARAGAWWGSAGIFFGCWFALLFAAYFTSMMAPGTTDFVVGLVGVSPTWYAVPLVVVGLLGGCGQGSMALYGTGLDTSSLVPRLSRVKATIVVSVVGVGLVYLGALVWDALGFVTAFTTLLTVITAPWLVINVMGHLALRGRYVPEDLQVFNVGTTGGIYWFSRGVNVYAMAAWILSVVLGLLFANTPPLMEGPWRNAAGGIDLSFLSAALAAFLIYGAFLWLVPARALPRTSGVPAVDLAAGAGLGS
ncbi:cytosine permease [Sphaerisporangium sp. NPDC088356]|uniref:purine-cytosine permease family protein n=1 Tax=Sphaerisporangium sp. NPDC088356 TaxID=3154871 RepID=UPI0034270F9E